MRSLIVLALLIPSIARADRIKYLAYGVPLTDGGNYSLSIDADGTLYESNGDSRRTRLSRQQLESTWQVVDAERFFELDREYVDPNWLDGWRESIEISHGDQHKKVTVTNVGVLRFQHVAAALRATARETFSEVDAPLYGPFLRYSRVGVDGSTVELQLTGEGAMIVTLKPAHAAARVESATLERGAVVHFARSMRERGFYDLDSDLSLGGSSLRVYRIEGRKSVSSRNREPAALREIHDELWKLAADRLPRGFLDGVEL